MFLGFKKIKSRSSDKIHLSTNGWRTVCGLPVKDTWVEESSVEDDDSVCKNCRSSVLNKGANADD